MAPAAKFVVVAASVLGAFAQDQCVCPKQQLCETLAGFAHIIKATVLGKLPPSGAGGNVRYIVQVTDSIRGTVAKGAKVTLQTPPTPKGCGVLGLKEGVEHVFTVAKLGMITDCGLNKPWASLDPVLRLDLDAKKAWTCARVVIPNAVNPGGVPMPVQPEVTPAATAAPATPAAPSSVPIPQLTVVPPPPLSPQQAKAATAEAAQAAAAVANSTTPSSTNGGEAVKVVSLGQLVGFGVQAPGAKQLKCSAIKDGCRVCIGAGCTWQPDGDEGFCTEACDFADMICQKVVKECKGFAPPVAAQMEAQAPLPPPSDTAAEAKVLLDDKKCFSLTEKGCTGCISAGCTWQGEAKACTLACAITGTNDCTRNATNCNVAPPMVAAPPPELINPEALCKKYTNCSECTGAALPGDKTCTWQPDAKMCTHACAVESTACIVKGTPCPLPSAIDAASLKPASPAGAAAGSQTNAGIGLVNVNGN